MHVLHGSAVVQMGGEPEGKALNSAVDLRSSPHWRSQILVSDQKNEIAVTNSWNELAR